MKFAFRFAGLLVAPLAHASPVERVVNLLQDLHARLVTDEKQEKQSYNKFACWCENTTARKADAIKLSQLQLRDLGQSILTLKGKIATYASEIDGYNRHIAALEKAMEDATAIRQKENGVFMAETQEIKQAILALQQAITVLVEATMPDKKGALLQTQARERATAALRNVISSLPQRVSLASKQMDQLNEFLEMRSGSGYMPQSLTVQGILTDMYSTFAKDLESLTAAEAASNKNFEDFMAVSAADKKDTERVRDKTMKLKAEAEVDLADNQQIFDDVTDQLKVDIQFFDETKAACVAKHDDWNARSGLRDEEINGIEEALAILTSDDARELFGKTIKAGKEVGASDAYNTGRDISFSFLQTKGSGSQAAATDAAARAFDSLKRSASTAHSLRLAALAVRLRTAKVGHFDAVIKSIDAMIKTLQEENTADIAKRDQCKEEYTKIESTIKQVTWLMKVNMRKINELERKIEKHTEEKLHTVQEIADLDAYTVQLTKVRKEENGVFLQSKKDDQDAIDLLSSARTALAKYYKKNDITMGPIQGSVKGLAFAQQPGPAFKVSADQAPDTEFSGKGKRKDETKDILSILTMLIEDLNDEIKNDMKAEEEAQLYYESLMDDAAKWRKELSDTVVTLDQVITDKSQKRDDEKLDFDDNERDLKSEKDYKASITDDCDFVLRTFEKRSADRTAEMNGLIGAKEFLAGYQPKVAGLVQFDDSTLPEVRFLGLSQ